MYNFGPLILKGQVQFFEIQYAFFLITPTLINPLEILSTYSQKKKMCVVKEITLTQLAAIRGIRIEISQFTARGMNLIISIVVYWGFEKNWFQVTNFSITQILPVEVHSIRSQRPFFLQWLTRLCSSITCYFALLVAGWEMTSMLFLCFPIFGGH